MVYNHIDMYTHIKSLLGVQSNAPTFIHYLSTEPMSQDKSLKKTSFLPFMSSPYNGGCKYKDSQEQYIVTH